MRHLRPSAQDLIDVSRYASAIRKICEENAKTAEFGTKLAGRKALGLRVSRVRDVDHEISAVAQRRCRPAFEPGTVRRRPISSGRMGPAGLDIALLQPLVITIDEHHPEMASAVTGDFIKGSISGPQVGANRNRQRTGPRRPRSWQK
jgi:hypothetical protein